MESCGFSWGDLLEDPDELFDGGSWTWMDGPLVLVATDVLVFLSSVVTEFSDDVSVVGFSLGIW